MTGLWLNKAGRPEPDVHYATMMPRLRVAIRVISEDEYEAHLGTPGYQGLYRGEKKFPIVISNPQSWQIGHLAAEIKRQYSQLFKKDIGTLKSISHGLDDCQLHKDLSVYEHLYNEGTSRVDPSDQNVMVKAVYSQGSTVRKGATVSDFDDPRYENRPLPPVPIPSWSETPSKYGKRSVEQNEGDLYSRENVLPRAKRRRLDDAEDGEIEDVDQLTQQEMAIDAADVPLPESPTLIQDSQSSPLAAPADLNRQLSLPTAKGVPLPKPHKHLVNGGDSMLSRHLPTPPSNASKKHSSGGQKPSLAPGTKRKISPIQATTSALTRPTAIKGNVYDNVEAIDDSQMSPKSKFAESQKSQKQKPASKHLSYSDRKSSADLFKGNVSNEEIVKLMSDPLYAANRVDDVEMQDGESSRTFAEPVAINKATFNDDITTATLRKASELARKELKASSHNSAAEKRQVPTENKKRRSRKSRVNDHKATDPMTIDTTNLPEDTEQNTSMDSPGEQLLEMQLSSQKSQQDSQPKPPNTAGKKLKKQQEDQTKTANTVMEPSAKKEQQKATASKGAKISQALSTAARQSIEISDKPNTDVKSPYARENPPKGSIGLGFTNSPKRPSIANADDVSLSKRKFSQTKPGPEVKTTFDALTDTESSSESDGESDSTAHTPSKTTRPTDEQTPYQRFTAKTKPPLQKSNSVHSDASRSSSVPLPLGMTLEQFEAARKRHEAKLATGEEMPKKSVKERQVIKAQAAESESPAPMAKTASKDSASSTALATSEKPKPKLGRRPKKDLAEREQAKPMQPEASKDVKAASESLTAAKLAKEERKGAKKTAKAANIPSTIVSEATKLGRPIITKPAAPSTASKPDTTKKRNTLKDLKHLMADRSTKSSPIPKPFTPSLPAKSKAFEVNDEEDESDDKESSSSSDDDDDLEQKTTRLLANSKPDASTRTARVDEDVDTDDEDDEDSD